MREVVNTNEKMKTVFITAIKGILIKDKLETDLILKTQLTDESQLEIHLTNDKNKIKSFLTVDLQTVIGQLEYEELENANLIAFSMYEINDTEISTMEFLNSYMRILYAFSLAMWLVKDSCLDFDQCFLNYTKDNKSYVDCNSMQGMMFNAEGKNELLEVSFEEVNKAKMYFENNLSLSSAKNDYSNFDKNLSRISIGLYFLQYSRQLVDLGLRISTYINAFEALFSTDNNELSHKLSERVAFLFAETPEERLLMYQNMKKAYGIRSKVFHGEGLDLKKFSEIRDISLFCDITLRKIILKILTVEELESIFKSDKTRLDVYFNELILKR